MKGFFAGWRKYLREAKGTPGNQKIRMLSEASEKRMISGKEAERQGVNIVDFDPEIVRRMAAELARLPFYRKWVPLPTLSMISEKAG